MATALIPSQAESANLEPADLSKARAAFVERVDAAADRAMRTASVRGMPPSLIEAGCFLADAGIAAPASRGEAYFGWDVTTCRQYLGGLNPAARRDEIEAGRAVLFGGSRAICPDLAVARGETAQVVDIMESRWARNSASHFACRDAGKAVAHG